MSIPLGRNANSHQHHIQINSNQFKIHSSSIRKSTQNQFPEIKAKPIKTLVFIANNNRKRTVPIHTNPLISENLHFASTKLTVLKH